MNNKDEESLEDQITELIYERNQLRMQLAAARLEIESNKTRDDYADEASKSHMERLLSL